MDSKKFKRYIEEYIILMESKSIAEIMAQRSFLLKIAPMRSDQIMNIVLALMRLEEYKKNGPKSTAEAFQDIIDGGGLYNDL